MARHGGADAVARSRRSGAGAGAGSGRRSSSGLALCPRWTPDFVVRRIECNHWRAEDTAGGARLREINAELGALRCERADADEAGLRRRFAGDRNVAWALDEVRDMLF